MAPTLTPAEAVAANPVWYHTMELGSGAVTSGQIDMRGTAAKILPSDLTGKRALDIGTFDGFWAFEMEKRGAATVAIDVAKLEFAEWPPLNRARAEKQAREWGLELGRGFKLASEALRSSVERIECPVQELAVDRIDGEVDFVFSGDILLHLRDMVGALERIHSVLRPGGRVLVLEPVAVRETILSPRRAVARFEPLVTPFNWWVPNLKSIRGWLAAAGFVDIKRRGFHRPPARGPMRQWHVALEASPGA
jgi:SAM-dependent methyltransferase